ncbi:TrlF family AAA-like ATPase [Terasakiella pusilla]|uniref:TrlF family AAA-like ATPase n=1 Tax=Terasakiella pusilla TaxID=64973 RepID=UPI0004909506|nr:AAA family ATPase [Terasakiella pusilla]
MCADWQKNVFSNGSNWVRGDFHLHTNADKEFIYHGEGNEFASLYVDGLKTAGIRVGAITNHNKFDVNEFKALRKKARKEGIFLMPGVELSVKDGANGIHTLVIFSDEWIANGNDNINSFLSTTFAGKRPDQYEQENARSNDDLMETIKKLESHNKDFFLIFAHVEDRSGLWAEMGGGRMIELGADPVVNRYCLGFQKVRTIDKPNTKCRKTVQEWWGVSYPAEVEGSDPKAIEQIGKGNVSYTKIGAPNFEAVKFALQDHANRASSTLENASHSRITAIRFEGGLLDKQRIEFSHGLNCLIGIRGSGKSSILEVIRYALDIAFGMQPQDKNYKENLVDHLLQSGGRVVVEVIDRHGQEYEIRRILKEAPDVYQNGAILSGISINETVLKSPLYFGQKDLSASGETFGQDLVEKLAGDKLLDVREKMSVASRKLMSELQQLDQLSQEAEKVSEFESKLKDIDHQLKIFDEHGVAEKLKQQTDFENDIRHCDIINQDVYKFQDKLKVFIKEFVTEFKDEAEYKSDVNSGFFKKYNAAFAEVMKVVSQLSENAAQLSTKYEVLKALKSELTAERQTKKDEFAEAKRNIQAALEKAGATTVEPEQFLALNSQKEQTLLKLSEATKQASSEKDKQNDVLTSLSELNNLWLEEFREIQCSLQQINDSQEALKVEADFKGSKNTMLEKLKKVFTGSGIRVAAYENIVSEYADFGAVYKDLDKVCGIIGGASSDKFRTYFLENLEDLLTFQVPNSFVVNFHGKPLSEHSLGQRASAMILFLLSKRENDILLIDQPEDDLDNQTIYEDVVKLIRQLKPEQQFIFATHNANFPVLGDAEQIVACQYENDELSLEIGSIDAKHMQDKIVSIMEGGFEAFDKRKSIYQLWNGPNIRSDRN